MMSRGSSLVSTVLALAAAAGVGVAGYYTLAGSCSSCTSDAAATPVAATPVEGESCCASEMAAVETVAAEGEACSAGKVCPITGEIIEIAATDAEVLACCETETEACCEGETAESCEIKCAADGEVIPAAMTTEAAEGEHCETKVCPITGQPIADSGK